jgi:hypothetical protein
MSNEKREALLLRAIVVTGHNALARTPPDAREAVEDRIDELLADLEATVIRDGGNQAIIDAIEAHRRRIRE